MEKRNISTRAHQDFRRSILHGQDIWWDALIKHRAIIQHCL
jgi:hypothetical protein